MKRPGTSLDPLVLHAALPVAGGVLLGLALAGRRDRIYPVIGREGLGYVVNLTPLSWDVAVPLLLAGLVLLWLWVQVVDLGGLRRERVAEGRFGLVPMPDVAWPRRVTLAFAPLLICGLVLVRWSDWAYDALPLVFWLGTRGSGLLIVLVLAGVLSLWPRARVTPGRAAVVEGRDRQGVWRASGLVDRVRLQGRRLVLVAAIAVVAAELATWPGGGPPAWWGLVHRLATVATVALVCRLVIAATGRSSAALLGGLVLLTLAPWHLATTGEVALLLAAPLVLWLLEGLHRRRVAGPGVWGALLGLTALAQIDPRLVGLLAGGLLLTGGRLWRRRRLTAALAAAIGVVGLVAILIRREGVVAIDSVAGLAAQLIGLLADRSVGLLFYAPVTLLGLVGLLGWAHRRSALARSALVLVVFHVLVLGLEAASLGVRPGTTLLPILPLAAVGVGLRQRGRPPLRQRFATLGAWLQGVLVTAEALRRPAAFSLGPAGRNAFLNGLSVGWIDVPSFLPSLRPELVSWRLTGAFLATFTLVVVAVALIGRSRPESGHVGLRAIVLVTALASLFIGLATYGALAQSGVVAPEGAPSRDRWRMVEGAGLDEFLRRSGDPAYRGYVVYPPLSDRWRVPPFQLRARLAPSAECPGGTPRTGAPFAVPPGVRCRLVIDHRFAAATYEVVFRLRARSAPGRLTLSVRDLESRVSVAILRVEAAALGEAFRNLSLQAPLPWSAGLVELLIDNESEHDVEVQWAALVVPGRG